MPAVAPQPSVMATSPFARRLLWKCEQLSDGDYRHADRDRDSGRSDETAQSVDHAGGRVSYGDTFDDATPTGIAATLSGKGYYIAVDNGGVHSFGDLPSFTALREED